MAHKRTNYDDEALVEAIAAGRKAHRQIGEEFGLSAQMVRDILHGRRRPELQPRIREAVLECLSPAEPRPASGILRAHEG